jgi:intracellular multiplication protein IcmE
MSNNENQSGIGRIVKDKGSRRMLMIAGVVVVGAVGVGVFGGGGGNAQEQSKLKQTPVGLDSGQGGSQVSQQYLENLQKADKDRRDAAAKKGESSIPTIVAQGSGGGLPPSLDGIGEKPKADTAEPQPPVPPRREEAKPQPQPQAQQPVGGAAHGAAQTGPARPAVDPQVLSAMQRQMQGLEKTTTAIQPAKTEWLYSAQAVQASTSQQEQSQQGFAPQQAAASRADAKPAAKDAPKAASAKRFQPPAPGTILYSHTLGKVNSDVPGPVIAEVLQGPFSGSRIIGSFSSTEEGVVITFNSMTVPYTDENGEARTEVLSIKAVAVDTSHLGDALATDIDDHMLSNIGWTLATSFAQGLGQAISQSGSTTTMSSTGVAQTTNPTTSMRKQLLEAMGTSGGQIGQMYAQKYGNRKTTVTVDADTPFGLLFLGNNGN